MMCMKYYSDTCAPVIFIDKIHSDMHQILGMSHLILHTA